MVDPTVRADARARLAVRTRGQESRSSNLPKPFERSVSATRSDAAIPICSQGGHLGSLSKTGKPHFSTGVHSPASESSRQQDARYDGAPIPQPSALRSNVWYSGVSHEPRKNVGVVPEGSTLESTNGWTLLIGE
jgi:hypothetical protein